jgi:BMFP domain-containing protein YqiC
MSEVVEREEWLVVMGILGDTRAELKKLNALLGGDDDGSEEEEEEGG